MRDELSTPEGRRILAARDIAAVYRLLKEAGVSQRAIAGCTGQSQSEVSEILDGRRVVGYHVLVRIAEGLDIPRGLMGLAFTSGEDGTEDYPGHDETDEPDEDVLRRKLLELGSFAAFGHLVAREPSPLPAVRPSPTPLPDRVGLADVRQFSVGTARLRALDRQFGGAGVSTPAAALARRGERLLPLTSSDEARHRLAAAVADSHLLAGWASFDAGNPDKGRAHFGRALSFCEAAETPLATAAVLYTIARMEIDSDAPNDGLKFLQVAQVGIANSKPTPIIGHFIQADVGRAYAELGYPKQAREAIKRAAGELPGEHTAADLMGITSAVQMAIGDYEGSATTLHELLPKRTETAARGAAGELVRLSTVCFVMGEVTEGLAVGGQALEAIERVPGSYRTVQRLIPLRDAAGERKDSACQDFAQVVRTRLSA